MPRQLKPATHDDWERLRRVLDDTRLIIDELKLLGCPQSLKQARALHKSLGGAKRHMWRRVQRQEAGQ